MTLGFQQKNAINLSSILAKWCLNDAMRLWMLGQHKGACIINHHFV
jgi:hypothetical protein